MKTMLCQCGQVMDVGDDCIRATCSRCVAQKMLPEDIGSGDPVDLGVTVRRLPREHCCNYIGGTHLGGQPCSVVEGKHCSFFQRAVLGSLVKYANTAEIAARRKKTCKRLNRRGSR